MRPGLAALALLAALGGCGEDAGLPGRPTIPGGDPARGLALIQAYGCGTCHTIKGVQGARGTVGPHLEEYGARTVLAGILPNTPANLVAWLLDPPALDPRTAMPAVGLGEGEARDVAAYLYSLRPPGTSVYPTDMPLPLRPNPPAVLPGRGPFVQVGARP